jgi:MoaA/NifB/PqqE/SkfB family radical SAM enzyme
MGLLIFDKKTGTNILLNEIIPKQVDKAPRHISIALTNKCNLSCGHCYIKHGTSFLNKEELKKWILELDCNGCLSVGFGGGEPTMYPDLIDLLQYVNQTAMASTLTTNGSASIEYYYEIAKYLDLIRFSIDGFYEVYFKNRKQSFDSIKSKITKISKYVKIGINYLLTDETAEQLTELKKFIENTQPYEILLLPYINSNGTVELSNKSIKLINKWLGENANKYPLCISFSGLHTFRFKYLEIQELSNRTQSKYFLHVDATKILMRNVFEKNGVTVSDSIISAIDELGGII